MFHSILLPLDGSVLAEAALPHAEALAEAFDAPIRLLRVIPVRQRGGAAPLDMIDRRLGQAEAGAYLDALAAELQKRGLTVSAEVLEGHPADRIIETVRTRDVDLVVLTTHGQGGENEFPICGTAQKVVARALVSLCVVPTSTGAHRLARPDHKYRRVLVGLDGSRRGDWAIGPAAALARHAGAELLLVHVVPLPQTVVEPASPDMLAAAEQLLALNRQAAVTRLAETKAHFEGPDLRVRTRLEVAPEVADVLADVAEAEQADLVVLAAHGSSASTRHSFGAVPMRVLGDVRRPVLVMQDLPRRHERPFAHDRAHRKTTFNHQ